MSQYLVIKKNGVVLGEWSRSTAMYDAFRGAPYDEEREFYPEETFTIAKSYIKDEVNGYKKSISKYKKMLQGNLGYEERWNCLTTIEDLKEEIQECKQYLYYIDFMEYCWECDRWEENPPKWTWVVE